MTNPTIWNQLLIWPIINVLMALYKLCEALQLPGAMGFAIIGLTIIMRVILYPVTVAQFRSAQKQRKLKPHLDALQSKHKDNKQALQQAQMALYKEHGVNPAAGCLPALLQLPILIALYNVFYQVFNDQNGTLVEQINQVLYSPSLSVQSLDLNFFGFPLLTRPSAWQTQGIWLLAVPLVTAALQWFQTKQMMSAYQTTPTVSATDKKITKDGKPEEKSAADTAMEMQKQMAIISPIMFGFISYQLPIGLALYWNVFGIFGIIQQYFLNKSYAQTNR